MTKKKYSAAIIRQLQFVFGVSIAILLISSFASYYSNKKLIESSQWVNHTNEVIKNAEGLISTARGAEAGQRGYVITNDASFLEPYKGAYEKCVAQYRSLSTLTQDNNEQQRTLEKIKILLDQRFAQMQRVVQYVTDKGLSGRTELYENTVTEMNKGKRIMDDLRVLVRELQEREKTLLAERIKSQEKYTTYTPVLVIVAAIISILISLLAYVRIKNDLEERVRQQREEEEKYEETVNRIVEMELVTQKIAAGDYKTHSKDEAKDELGRISSALNKMVESLDTNFTELNKRNWLQTGTLNITKAIRGERFIKSLSQKIINSVAQYLDAQVGTLYVADNNLNLRLQGGFAIADAPSEIAPGEGLTGQAVLSKELILSDELPPSYLTIRSSVGQTQSVFAVVQPLLYDEQVIGVLELGLLKKPGALAMAYLQDNAESLAIAINAAINYERMQDLLEETQAQAEELQSQHNELENINAELETQTEKLQASDEELRVQQEELQQANQELEERSRLLEERNYIIQETNLEVKRKAADLEQSTKYKSEFLANMSHELRTPLNSILLLSRLLAENNDGTLNNDQVEYAKVIQSSGNGLLLLIDEILDLSKIEAGKMSLEYEAVAIGEIVSDMKSIFEPMAREKDISFDISSSKKETDQIVTDKLRVEQVLKNLISNALKFTRKGSITLHIADSKIDGFINLSVEDTGIGIAEDKQNMIFEAFQQEDGSTRRKYGGTGLGLSISKELARLLGGDISLESTQGKGSTFTLSIPVSQENTGDQGSFAEAPPLPEAQQQEDTETARYLSTHIPESIPDERGAIKAGDRSILIVEDDTNFAKSLLDFTRKSGYKGIVSVRGDEAVPLARQFKPTGILLDIQLPVKSGLQVMEELKGDPQTRPIPVHIMSSHALKKESMMKGAINFIDKPVAFEQMQDIFRKLEHVLNRDSKKVLIVEDNPMHAKALAYFLETFNINSDIKNTISESIEALKADADCVILDMGIPDNKSYSTLEEVKRNPELEDLPIIVFTGKSLSMTEEQRIKKYADSIVVKTAHSYQRILDEVSIFLHMVQQNEEKTGSNSFKKLGVLNDVLKHKTVLVVDDDVRNIFSLSKALEQMNMNVVTAIDGKEAMEKLKTHTEIDIVLLDMMMPQMDGYETARRIRDNGQWKNLPVIAVTAKAMTGDREKCIKAGASDYITKPVDIDQLLSLLRVWLYDKTNKNNA
ncbi:MAG TPA: response regulator [Chitinophagaceae bacterium]|nr:response regulator [Chitinophagaceae bacterium]